MTKLASAVPRHRVIPLGPACGRDPVSYSAPVGIELKAKSGDAPNGVIAEQKDITTESGNRTARSSPMPRPSSAATTPAPSSSIALTLTLGGQTTGVTALDEIFTGPVDVQFLMNTSSNTYPVGTVTDPVGHRPGRRRRDSFDDTQVGGRRLDRAARRPVQGGATRQRRLGFTTKGADATLQLTFTFAAFEISRPNRGNRPHKGHARADARFSATSGARPAQTHEDERSGPPGRARP